MIFTDKEDKTLNSIIDFAKRDVNVRAAILNGSRANPNAPKDFMMDYDIALYLKDLREAVKYKQNTDWVNSFGRLVIMQQNNFEDGFVFLLQYENGIRIDLSFYDIFDINRNIKKDSLSVVLFDLDKSVSNFPSSNESSYYVVKPTKEKWNETLNNIWWLQPYIAKELWRDEVPLAKELYDEWIMKHLSELISWQIAIEKGWQVNVGHGCKWFKNLLHERMYKRFLYFYSSADKSEQWEKLLRIGGFIREIALPLSETLGFEYPLMYDENVSEYIRRIYALSPDSVSF